MRKALAYPYIDIPHENWLKMNLLLNDQIQRILPVTTLNDEPDWIKPYVEGRGAADALLSPASLYAEENQRRQIHLAERLRQRLDNDDSKFAEKHGLSNFVGSDSDL
mgnify:FL=1